MPHDVNQSEMDVAAQVRSALVDRISSERYDLWMPSDTKWSWDANRLTISFPNRFTCQLAQKMLHQDLVAVATQMQPGFVEVNYIESSDDATNQPSSEAPSNAHSLTDDLVTQEDAQLELASQQNSSAPTITQTQSALSLKAAVEEENQRRRAEVVARQAVKLSSREEDPWQRFVRGSCNELAFTAAQLAINDPGRLTPILLHGPNGCGKSHLASAVSGQLRGVRRLRRVVQMTSEQFTNDFMEGLRGGGLPLFRRKYRDVDALILDDVQFFAGKKATIAEVNHTLDNLIRGGKQVVFTADRSLNELERMGPDLVGRLRGGLVAPLFSLDTATRCELLARQLEKAQVEIDRDIVSQLAERVAGDGRVLRGLANRLIAAQSVRSETLDWDVCWNAVFDLVQATRPVVRLRDIERVVCNVFGLDENTLQSSSKMRSVSQPRMLAMFLARKYTPAAYKEIGAHFGKRHSTVISAEKTVQSWLRDGAEFTRGMTIQDAIRHVESQLQVS